MSDFPAMSAEPEPLTMLCVFCRSTSVLGLPESHMSSKGGIGTDVWERDSKHSSQVIVAPGACCQPCSLEVGLLPSL